MKIRKVCGVGINDADYNISNSKISWKCPYYLRWKGMIDRCYSESFHKTNPAYELCYVCDEWLTFSKFREWMVDQDWEGKALDKDLLFVENVLYSPETCVFIGVELNGFLNKCRGMRGDFLIGAVWSEADKRFRSACRNPFTKKAEFLGSFEGEDEAHEAWKAKKQEHALVFADLQVDHRISTALRGMYK
jgi:hypothetical protein